MNMNQILIKSKIQGTGCQNTGGVQSSGWRVKKRRVSELARRVGELDMKIVKHNQQDVRTLEEYRALVGELAS